MSNELKFKKLYFMGAGSTSALKLPTTERQNEYLKKICFGNDCNFCFDKSIVNICEDWLNIQLLKQFVNDFFMPDNFTVNLFFNVCDIKLLNKQFLSKNGHIYSTKQIQICKNTIKCLIFCEFYEAINNNYNKEYLTSFYKKLALNCLNSTKIEKDEDVEKRNFIFTDYAVVNLNWDLFSIMPLLIAHKQINNEKHSINLTNSYKRFEIFNDFAEFMACNSKDNNDVWYPYNEAAALRVNRIKDNPNRIVRLVKTFYPHGLMNLYKCNVCGMHTLNVGDIAYNSKVLNNSLINNEVVLKCPHCGEDIHAMDIEYLEQTNHKISCSYLEEIALDMKNALSNSEEIVFIGYSLPDDDIDYNEMFITCINNLKKVKVVLYDNNYDKHNCFENREYYSQLNYENLKTVERFCRVFSGVDEIKFNFAGAPKCFECDELYH